MNNPNAVIMVRPANFGFNAQTAASNKFQKSLELTQVNDLAIKEFDVMVGNLIHENLDVRVLPDVSEPKKPDAIFPNNWISFHPDGRSVLYPMEAENRRLERRLDVFDLLENYDVEQVLDVSSNERDGKYLEGTGSVIFDHENRVAYCAQSSRSDVQLFEKLSIQLGFAPISFEARDINGHPIYHTNVMLSIGQNTIVVCSESIENPVERNMMLNELNKTEKVLIDISFSQMNNFAANCLEVNDKAGKACLVMSKTAFDALLPDQKKQLESVARLISVNIPTIERIGGGSARCMLLGVY